MAYQRLGEPARARACYDRANAAVQAEANLAAGQVAQLTAIRAEAEDVLGIADGK